MESVWTLSLFLSFSFFFYELLLERVDCAGKDSGGGASTPSPKPDEWQMALDLPDNQVAPECLRSHIKEETLSDTMFDHFISPLALDEAKVGAYVAYNVNPVADQFQRAFQTSTISNRLYSFFNKRWFFDQVLNDFLVRSFLRFGYEVSFEALDKGAIEILGPYGISYTFRRLAERISQLQSGFVDIRGSSEWRFPCREPDEGRPSRPVRRAGISRPYYHYAFAMLLGSTLFVTFSRMWDSLSSWVDNRSSFIWIVSSFYNNKSSQ
ncbi:unnamed protein product [Withania somnifera]